MCEENEGFAIRLREHALRRRMVPVLIVAGHKRLPAQIAEGQLLDARKFFWSGAIPCTDLYPSWWPQPKRNRIET